MIKLENVNKYFNHYRKNQIHVIDNVNISLPTKGLVAILGPSGSGKTTLLNAIGGLDKITSGHIYVDGQRITRRSSHKIDKIRNINIGYIFQDYKLVDNLSVFDNVALSLKLIGFKDKEEIKKRVMYVLEKVGIERFKNRPANMLSGGERQRVGIARALVKNPKIIIADEPTGNLDSKTSLEVMDIIKSISENTLVILVTHEEELAKFYATRIIELQDGKIINDYENAKVDSLAYDIENRIYLKDYKDIKNIQKDNININVYRNNNENVDINLVFKNGNIYIASLDGAKLEVVENNSNIELIDGHKEKIKNSRKIDFNLDVLNNNNFKIKYSSIFRLISYIPYGFKKILDYPVIKKILLGGFFLSGMFIFYAISSIAATLNIEDKDFININKNYLTVNVKNIKVDEYLNYESNNLVEYMLPNNSQITLMFPYDKYIQTQNAYGLITASLSDINFINENNLLMGRMPLNKNEVVLDKLLIENFINQENTKTKGFFKIEDFLNHSLELDNMPEFTIVGITNKEELNIYSDQSIFTNLISNSYDNNNDLEKSFVDYNLLLDKIKLVNGKLPDNDYEVIVSLDKKIEMPLNKNIDIKINNHKLKVVGYYKNISSQLIDDYLVNNNTIKYNLISNEKILTIYSKDKVKALDFFKKEKLNIQDSYAYAKEQYLEMQHDSITTTLIMSGIILGISLIEILLMIRSSFLSRIKEVGIYRAIGIKKSDIYKMFSGEILAITTIASVMGIAFMNYIIYCLTKVPYVENLFMVNPLTFIISIIIVYFFNLIVGLIPVYNTIRKTPAEILARYDID